MSELLEALAPNPLIAILRAPDAAAFAPVTETLYAAGIPVCGVHADHVRGDRGHAEGAGLDAR